MVADVGIEPIDLVIMSHPSYHCSNPLYLEDYTDQCVSPMLMDLMSAPLILTRQRGRCVVRFSTRSLGYHATPICLSIMMEVVISTIYG